MTTRWMVALRTPDAQTLEVAVYDMIGKDFWGDGIGAQDFLARLRSAPDAKKISLRVNSVGGLVDDAKAMVNLLGERAAAGVDITATVDGLAASSASYLLTAAKRVVMPANAYQMLHGVRGVVRGTADEIAAASELFRRTNEQLAEAYAAASQRRGKEKTKSDYLGLFNEGDTYFDADQAIAWGLADEKIEPLKVAACLADVRELASAPEAVRSAPYVLIAAISPTPNTPPVEPPAPQPTNPGPVARQETDMKTIALATIAAILGLAVDGPDAADEEGVLSAIKKLKATPPSEQAVNVSGVKLLGVATEAEATARVNELNRVSIGLLGLTGKGTHAEAILQVTAWQTAAGQALELAAKVNDLEASVRVAKRDGSIEKLSREGRLAPAAHAWARLNFQTAEALESFALTMPPMSKFGPREPDGEESTELTAEQRQVCVALGIKEADYLAQLKEDNKRARAQVGA